MKSQYRNGYWMPRHLAPRYSEIESAVSITPLTENINVNDDITHEKVLAADSAFFNIFTTETVEGSKEQFALSDHNCVISQSYARKMFGDRSPIGKSIKLIAAKTAFRTTSWLW